MFLNSSAGAVLVIAVLAWILTTARWSGEAHPRAALIALFTSTLVALYPFAAVWYVHRFGLERGFDISLEARGMLLSLLGLIACAVWLRRTRRLVPFVLLITSVWMLLLWFYLGSIAF